MNKKCFPWYLQLTILILFIPGYNPSIAKTAVFLPWYLKDCESFDPIWLVFTRLFTSSYIVVLLPLVGQELPRLSAVCRPWNFHEVSWTQARWFSILMVLFPDPPILADHIPMFYIKVGEVIKTLIHMGGFWHCFTNINEYSLYQKILPLITNCHQSATWLVFFIAKIYIHLVHHCIIITINYQTWI